MEQKMWIEKLAPGGSPRRPVGSVQTIAEFQMDYEAYETEWADVMKQVKKFMDIQGAKKAVPAFSGVRYMKQVAAAFAIGDDQYVVWMPDYVPSSVF